MRKELAELGWNTSDIKGMSPERAHNVIENCEVQRPLYKATLLLCHVGASSGMVVHCLGFLIIPVPSARNVAPVFHALPMVSATTFYSVDPKPAKDDTPR
jgi:hypothetical protein